MHHTESTEQKKFYLYIYLKVCTVCVHCRKCHFQISSISTSIFFSLTNWWAILLIPDRIPRNLKCAKCICILFTCCWCLFHVNRLQTLCRFVLGSLCWTLYLFLRFLSFACLLTKYISIFTISFSQNTTQLTVMHFD